MTDCAMLVRILVGAYPRKKLSISIRIGILLQKKADDNSDASNFQKLLIKKSNILNHVLQIENWIIEAIMKKVNNRYLVNSAEIYIPLIHNMVTSC